MALQSAVLGVGAYLVIQQEATAGIIIASSILAGRALAPIDLAIANWKGFVAARQSWQRLDELLAASSRSARRALELPAPAQTLSLEALSVAPPGAKSLGRAGCRLHPESRQRPGRRRTERLGQVVAGARASSACGPPPAAACGSTARRSISGRRRRAAATSGTCRRMSSCSTEPLRRTSPGSSR